MQLRLAAFTCIVYFLTSTLAFSQKQAKSTGSAPDNKKDPFQSATFNGLKWRSIGPALTSGRIVDLAINPKNKSEYYVASANGGVWKTTDGGTTYEPIFESEK